MSRRHSLSANPKHDKAGACLDLLSNTQNRIQIDRSFVSEMAYSGFSAPPAVNIIAKQFSEPKKLVCIAEVQSLGRVSRFEILGRNITSSVVKASVRWSAGVYICGLSFQPKNRTSLGLDLDMSKWETEWIGRVAERSVHETSSICSSVALPVVASERSLSRRCGTNHA